MARYTGPTTRISRRFGQHLLGSGKAFERRGYPPGVHGAKMRRKVSEYAVGLNEKQKLRYIYGLLERQFRNIYHRASQKKGITGEALLQMLESRLDNITYKMGFGASRSEARQIVRHNGILVNGKRVNIPSYQLRPGDVVEVAGKAKEHLRIKAALESTSGRGYPEWLEVDTAAFKGTFKTMPQRSDLPSTINESLVVELYSK